MAYKYYYDGSGALIAVKETTSNERQKLEAANSQSSDTTKSGSRSHLSVVPDNHGK